MSTPERIMRVMKFAFIVSVLLFILLAIRIPSKAAHPPQQPVELVVILIGLVNLALGWNGRRLLSRIAQANAGGAAKATPLNQWFSANIFSLALMESCALFALVLHLLGSSAKLAGILFGCALLALLAWSPGRPPASQDASGISG